MQIILVHKFPNFVGCIAMINRKCAYFSIKIKLYVLIISTLRCVSKYM